MSVDVMNTGNNFMICFGDYCRSLLSTHTTHLASLLIPPTGTYIVLVLFTRTVQLQ